MRNSAPSPIFSPRLEPSIARSLSLQFILHEWIRAFEIVRHLEVVTPIQLGKVDLHDALSSVLKELEKLLFFSSHQKGGALDKLCFYYAILLQASSMSDMEIETILQEMKALIVKVKSEMILWKRTKPFPGQMSETFSTLYSHLRRKLTDFFKKLFPFFLAARSDENVLVYLIEHKEKLNAFLGMRQVEELLALLFPEGPAVLRKSIQEGYERRGFSSFFCTMEPLIDQIEWEPACNFLQK